MKISPLPLLVRTELRTYHQKGFRINYDKNSLLASYKNVSISSLLLASWVLGACQIPWITSKMGPIYVKYALRYPSLFMPINEIVKRSFFRHFCGGSTTEEISRTTKQLAMNGVGSILDPAMEEDLKEIDLFPNDRILPQLGTSASSIFDANVMGQRKIVIEDAINAATLSTMELSAGSKPKTVTFVALKLTCMVPTGLLYLLTSSLDFLISKLEEGDNALDHLVGKGSKDAEGGHPTLIALKKEISAAQSRHLNVSARTLVFSALQPELLLKFYLDIYLPANGHAAVMPSEVDTKNLQQSLANSIAFCREIFEFAAKKSIALMVDAEQTYFQTAIHYLAFVISRDAPLLRSKPTIFSTYQMYLKDGLRALQQDHQLYAAYAIPFALKVVRGAYMQSESARAANFGLSSPINDSITKTHEDYAKAIDFLLAAVQRDGEHTAAFFATHNVESIEKILSQAKGGGIMIGQLLGMADHLTFSIANSQLATPYKYVPVGTLQEVLPYLLRRAQENSSLFGRAADERNQIKTVLLAKLKCSLPFPSPKAATSKNAT